MKVSFVMRLTKKIKTDLKERSHEFIMATLRFSHKTNVDCMVSQLSLPPSVIRRKMKGTNSLRIVVKGLRLGALVRNKNVLSVVYSIAPV